MEMRVKTCVQANLQTWAEGAAPPLAGGGKRCVEGFLRSRMLVRMTESQMASEFGGLSFVLDRHVDRGVDGHVNGHVHGHANLPGQVSPPPPDSLPEEEEAVSSPSPCAAAKGSGFKPPSSPPLCSTCIWVCLTCIARADGGNR